MTPVATPLTLEAYLAYDDGTDLAYELVNGVLVAMPQPTGEHENLAELLFLIFKAEIERLQQPWTAKQGKVAVASPRSGRWDTARIPDVVVLTLELWQSLHKREALIHLIDPPPLLAVEIVSESTRSADYRAKRAEYSVLEILEYWIVDPLEQKITVCLLVEGLYDTTEFTGSDVIHSEVFPELELTVDQVFRSSF